MDLLRHLALFRRVADCGSFSRAAELEGLAPSSVSSAIGQLERHLGARLFQRTTRQVRLSSDGERLYARGVELLADADGIAQLFRPDAQPSGLLRVEAPARMARLLLAPALPAFLEAYPGIAIELGGQRSTQQSDWRRHRLRAAGGTDRRPGPGRAPARAVAAGHLRRARAAGPARAGR